MGMEAAATTRMIVQQMTAPANIALRTEEKGQFKRKKFVTEFKYQKDLGPSKRIYL